MSLEGLRPEQITEATLEGLISAQVPEGRTLDYKRELPASSDGAKKEFLADVCSFANAVGGHLIFGVDEAEGLPTNLAGVGGDVDQAILRLESIARDGIRPPIPGLALERVSLTGDRTAVVVAVPKSWNPPHQVIFQKDFRFYTRGSAGKQHLDVDELRRIVLQSQEIGERIRQFRAGRLAAIMADDTPVKLVPGARQILHFIPLTAFGAGSTIDISPVNSEPGILIRTMGVGGSLRHNVDGLIAYSQRNSSNESYVQLYRSGILEIINSIEKWNANGKRLFPSLRFEQDFFEQIQGAITALARIGAPLPLAVMLSFIGINGWEMAVAGLGRGGRGGFDRDPLLIPELVTQDFESDDVPRRYRPIVDAVWNAAGYPMSDNYSEEGDWVPRR